MKRFFKVLTILLVIVLSATTVAFAAAGDVVDGEKATITLEVDGTTVTFDETNAELMHVTITSASLVPDNQYLIFVVAGDGSSITEETILYIDQSAAAGSEGAGTLAFDVYPSSLKDSVILITGVADGKLKLAVIDMKYVIGDANEDGVVDIADIIRIANYLVGKASVNSGAADANADGAVDISDIIRIANFLVGKATLG